MTPTLVQITGQERWGKLLLADADVRIEHYATLHQPDVDATTYAKSVTGRVWVGDATVCLLGLVEPDNAKLVGHVLATQDSPGKVLIAQASDDGGITATLKLAVDHARAWAVARGAEKIMLASLPKQSKQWEKLGFKPYRHVLMFALEGAPKADGASPDPRP